METMCWVTCVSKLFKVVSMWLHYSDVDLYDMHRLVGLET